MQRRQLDLFRDTCRAPPAQPAAAPGAVDAAAAADDASADAAAADALDAAAAAGVTPPAPAGLAADALIAAITHAGTSASAVALAAEAGRRRLEGAVPALEQLCRRFSGFGCDRMIAEQHAAIEALAAIGGREAAAALARSISRQAVEGPLLPLALAAAAGLGVELPREVAGALLHHAQRRVRAAACRCVHVSPDTVPLLIDLIDDLDPEVVAAAACALGRLRRPEALPTLLACLESAPTPEVIDAVTGVAGEGVAVLLERIARRRPDLADAVCRALDEIGTARALQALARLG